jgi:hypothetical protein
LPRDWNALDLRVVPDAQVFRTRTGIYGVQRSGSRHDHDHRKQTPDHAEILYCPPERGANVRDGVAGIRRKITVSKKDGRRQRLAGDGQNLREAVSHTIGAQNLHRRGNIGNQASSQ